MEKITKKALELAGFKNADQIALILSHVPNPQVGLEILLGIYEPIDVITHPMKFFKYRHADDFIYEIISIDELGDKVFVKRYKHKTKQIFFATEEDKKTNKFVEERPNPCYTSQTIYIDGLIIEEDTKVLSSINDSNIRVTSEEFFNILRTWDPLKEAWMPLV